MSNLNASAIKVMLTITGGTVTGQGRLMSGSSVGWRVDVTPDGNGEVTITLPTSEGACNRE